MQLGGAEVNPITFNNSIDPAKDFLLAFGDRGKDARIISDSVLNSPIFTWNDFDDTKLSSINNQDVGDLISSKPNLLPFREMRLWVTPNASDSRAGTTAFKWWINHSGGSISAVCQQFQSGMEPFTFQIRSEFESNPVRIGVSFRMGNRFHFPQLVMDESRAAARGNFTTLCWFIREASSPANFIARVEPDKAGKSIEWTRARTHYVVINKSHPANNKDVSAGQSVSVGSEYIKRQAHSRRAHARILRSPKFKNKIGQTVMVRACWVGPQEWKQFGSIYKMMR